MFPTNTELTISMITNRALIVLENNLTFSNTVDKSYNDSFGVDGAKIGATINIRKPVQYLVTMGPAMQPQSFIETYVPLTLTSQAQVSVRLEDDGHIATGVASDTDTLTASAKAYINCLNNLFARREKSRPPVAEASGF